MNNFNENINKYKKYAFRKIGKYFGPCVIGTMISLGVAVTVPSNNAHAAETASDGEPDIENIGSASEGYEVIIPKGKKYIRNDEIESHKPVLKEEGYNGRSFILPKKGEDSYFFEHPMSELFTKLYDKDNDGNVDDEYKNPESVDNSHAGETIDGGTVPYRSEINPKYPHVVDSGLTSNTDDNQPGVWKYNPDGKYKNSNGVIDEYDNIVVARKPFTIDENAEDNVVKDDGSVVLTGEYNIHVNEGDHIDKKDDVYEVGTKPKVERTPIPFETTYQRDDSVPEGTEEEVTAGKNGETVKTTTYELNPTTGEVTANEPTSETTNPITRVVKRGTQPKPGETPETPQPKPGETPGKPTQPEQPSGTEDQPDLKVAPPTIAIIEEPNKASFEVKAPKKDADTVKITYPKSDGSGNEVLTLTKQPSGEWTLDKKPENVTLDKTTGTVTIPRESVVNKQKVQAQSKHKTSGYTPFVFAALSIEEANPEHPVTLWVDTADKEIKEKVIGKKVQAGEIAGYKWLSSRLEEGILTHKFKKVTNETSSIPNQPESVTNNTNKPSNSTPEKSSEIKKSLIRTVWKTQDGKELKSPSTDKQEAGEFEGYEFVESHLEGDNVTVHVFRAKKTATNTPNEKTTQPEERQVAVATVTSDKKEEETLSSPTSEKVELPNTGTVTNGFFTVEVAAILAGLGILIPGVKKKETEE